MPASSQITQLAKDDQDFVLRDKIGLILGGMPDTNDVVPSALIVIMYVALFAPIVFRIRTHTLTFGQVWKPLLFILMRIATFAMRIQLAQTSQWKNTVFITQLIFLRLGPIILTSALVRLFGDAVLPYLPSVDAPNLFVKISLKYFVSALNILTYFCLGLTIAVAFDVKQAINGNVEARAKLHRSKEISIWLLVAINSSIYLLTIIPIVLLQQGRYVRHLLVSRSREHSKFMAVLSVCTFLLVVSGFKAAQLMSHGLHTTYVVIINKKILFYSICCFGEYVACLLLVTAAWARIVPPPDLLEAYCRIHKQRMQQDGQADRHAPPMQATATLTQMQRGLPYATIPRPGFDESGEQSGAVSRAPGGIYATPGKEIIPRVAKIIHKGSSNGHDEASCGIQENLEELSHGESETKDREDVTWSTIPINAPNETEASHRSATTATPQQHANLHSDTPTPRRVSSTTLSTISEITSSEDEKAQMGGKDDTDGCKPTNKSCVGESNSRRSI